jgi:uncharacterized surface protein with fasciclin (FAS1) repeats
MKQNNYLALSRPFLAFTGIAGILMLGTLPIQAQTVPTPTQSPSEIEQPANPSTLPADAPSVDAPSVDAPSVDVLSNSENQSPTELLQQLSATGSFTTLAQAVEAAGLSDSLQGSDERYTIFAPTDEAFAELPQGVLEQLIRPENRALLQQVLSYHVVPTELTSDQLNTGGVDTFGGGIAVRVTPERIIVNNGSVIQSDIETQNGTVHVINRVLMPSALRQQLTSLQ